MVTVSQTLSLSVSISRSDCLELDFKEISYLVFLELTFESSLFIVHIMEQEDLFEK